MAADLYSENKPIGGTAKNIEIDPSPTPSGSDLERSASDATSCISSVGHVSSSQKEINAGHKMSEADYGFSYPTAGYYGYYYPGYDGYSADSNAQAYVPDVQYPVMQADAGSYYYFFPGSGYSGYDPQMPIGTVAVDGQYFGQQLYQPSPVLTPTADSCGIYPTTFSYGAEYSLPSYAWDSSFMVAEGLQGSGYAGVSGSQGHGANQLKPPNKVQGPQHDSTFQLDGLLTKGHHPKYPFNHQRNDGVLYSSNPTNSGKSGKPWDSTEKTKLRSKASAVCDLGHTNGQKYDSRASFIEGNITRLSVDGNGTGNNTTIIRRDQYNLPDFLTKYDQALFFVIKSYSEDDIHKSIKYNVWASTSNGNKRLDSAYLTAQEKAKERGSKCPVFLFFSVNASGQFCGVAEMVGRVNFDKSMDFWQQDKWNGYFPVKWHIIKDVSNQCLRHIILENNDNKPVTNSRDTQEVYFSQGIELLNTFKSHPIKTSILDDFGFYESREKIMQSKRTTPPASHFDHMQKKVDEITSCINSIDLQGSVKPGDPVAGNMGED